LRQKGRQRDTETDRDRQRQAETGRDRQIDTDRHREAETTRAIYSIFVFLLNFVIALCLPILNSLFHFLSHFSKFSS
jgi:hypothetical protein